MPTINLEIQLKFLNELNEALTDALSRYAGEGEDKLAELTYMKQEVVRARRVITERMAREVGNDAGERRTSRHTTERYQEAVYS